MERRDFIILAESEAVGRARKEEERLEERRLVEEMEEKS